MSFIKPEITDSSLVVLVFTVAPLSTSTSQLPRLRKNVRRGRLSNSFCDGSLTE